MGFKKKQNTAQPRKCRDDEFKCDNGACINSEFYCDGHPDCIDNSDEPRSCPGREITDFL